MTQQLYDNLWHYTEQFTRDSLQRSELLTMAWKEGERLGERSSLGLMKSHMHFRNKELKKRSAFPAKEVGKRTIDAYNRPHRVHLEQPLSSGETRTVGDVVLNTYTTPLDFTITNDFFNSLTEQERTILEDLSSGYAAKEIKERNHLNNSCFKSLRKDLATKAIEYLV